MTAEQLYVGNCQEAAGEVGPSEPTVPGPGQGIYGCDYHALVGIYAHVAEARVHMLQGQGSSAEVCPSFPTVSTLAVEAHAPCMLACVAPSL